jgi:flagellar motor component MotA
MDLVASVFALRNMANALVTVSASIQGAFMQFHKQIVASLDKMIEVLVKEQAAVQRDWFVAFRLLKQITEALERSSPWQVEVVLIEGLVAEGTEIVLVVIVDVEWAQTPLKD